MLVQEVMTLGGRCFSCKVGVGPPSFCLFCPFLLGMRCLLFEVSFLREEGRLCCFVASPPLLVLPPARPPLSLALWVLLDFRLGCPWRVSFVFMFLLIFFPFLFYCFSVLVSFPCLLLFALDVSLLIWLPYLVFLAFPEDRCSFLFPFFWLVWSLFLYAVGWPLTLWAFTLF